MGNTLNFEANLCADELVAAGSTIEITFPAPVDARTVQGAVQLVRGHESVEARVGLAKHGRVVTVALADHLSGAFALVIRELLDEKGGRLVDAYRLPFAVIPFCGKVPRNLRIEHAVRLVISDLHVTRLSPGEVSEGDHIDVLKAVHRKSGKLSEIAFDRQGRSVDIAKRFDELAKRRADKYGRLHEALFARLERAAPNEQVPVVVWPNLVLQPAPYEKPADRRSTEPPDEERELVKALRKQSAGLLKALQRYEIALSRDPGPDDGVPCVRLAATPAQLRALSQDKAVGVIHFDDVTAINDLGNSIAVARSDRAHTAGFDGTGVRVAVWESGPSDTTNLKFAGRFSSSPAASGHARLTSAIIKNTEADRPHGHAPDCDLYSANASGTDALRWAVRDQHCTVVSQSFHRSSEPGGSGLQSDDLLKDWLALRWPYPTIVQAAGNFWLGDDDKINPPSDEFVNHKGYNSIAVGNHDDTAAAMSGDSVFRNPITTHGDRELPEVAANGMGVSAVGETRSGTSFAAPAAAGVVALLQDVDRVLCSWPEGCRAILFASAGRNVRDNTWWQDVLSRVDGRDGAGAVDAQSAVAIAQQRRWRDAPATRRGWDVGTLSSAVVGADRIATFRYRIAVPSRLFFPTVKVALAWDSAVTSSTDTATASTLTIDLDLLVRDSGGNQVAAAASWDNSYEVVEFSGRPGETYEIVLRRWSGTDSVWYGVAWTVTGLSFLFPWDTPLVKAVGWP